MGPPDAPLARYAVQLTDLTCVVYSMQLMTRVSSHVFDRIRARGSDFFRCVHSVGLPRYRTVPYLCAVLFLHLTCTLQQYPQ